MTAALLITGGLAYGMSPKIVTAEPSHAPVVAPSKVSIAPKATQEPVEPLEDTEIVESIALPAPAPEPAPQPSQAPAPAPRPTGTKYDWMTAAGIPQSEWWAVDYIVSRESGWNPCAYNPGQSDCSANPTSACGLAQSLPCGKQSVYGHWTDPVANLKWQHDYVRGRYGGYPQAVAFWSANHWY